MKKNRCPFCPKEFQSLNDMHKHLKKIHNADMDDDTLDGLIREMTIGDMCNWDETEIDKAKTPTSKEK